MLGRSPVSQSHVATQPAETSKLDEMKSSLPLPASGLMTIKKADGRELGIESVYSQLYRLPLFQCVRAKNGVHAKLSSETAYGSSL